MTDSEITADLISEGMGAFDELELLGSGTFGTTFRAVRGDDEYALKVIHLAEMPDHLWEREIAALQTVDHPNVVGFQQAGTFTAEGKDYRYLRCEYIDGGSIKSCLEAGSQPGDAKALRELLTGLLAGVGELHDLGIFHRDIKPDNVALRESDWGQPVLLDFGLAKVMGMSTHTALGQMIGTPAYMSPEQLRGEPARTRSDLFAVGLVVYVAGTGRHPFMENERPSIQSLHERIAAGPPTDPRQLAPDHWSDPLAEVTLRLLRFEAHERLSVDRALAQLEGGDA
jgi:serine/threonine protein kinase